MCFVSWSAATAASAIAASPSQCVGTGAERPLRDGERREPVRCRPHADVGRPYRPVHPRSASRLQSMQSDAHGYASSRSAEISRPQFSHVP